MPVVEATGHAQASSPYRSNPARARELHEAVKSAIDEAHVVGAPPEAIQGRINMVRYEVAAKHHALEAKMLAERVERENRIRAELRRQNPDAPPTVIETMARAKF
jgi:hypothetical protein